MEKDQKTPRKLGGKPLSPDEYEAYITGGGPKPQSLKSRSETIGDEEKRDGESPSYPEEEIIPDE